MSDKEIADITTPSQPEAPPEASATEPVPATAPPEASSASEEALPLELNLWPPKGA